MIIIARDILTDLRELKPNSREKRQTVLACREDIERGRNAGYSLRKIWTVLTAQKKTDYSYLGFVRAVRVYIDGKNATDTAPPVTPKKKEAVQTSAPAPSPPPSSPKPDAGTEKYHVYRPPPPEPKKPVEEPPDELTDEQVAEITARIQAQRRRDRP